ncbi:hypothetical protein VPH35_081320 [Triticum aestivum]
MSTDADRAAAKKAEADKKAAEDAAAAATVTAAAASATAVPPAAPAAPMPLVAVQEVPVAALQAVQAGRRICKNIMLCKNMAVQSPEVKKLRHLPTPPPPG